MHRSLPQSFWLSAVIAACAFVTVTCTSSAADLKSTVSEFGSLPDGKVIKQFTLQNSHGMKATIIEYGATITELSFLAAMEKSSTSYSVPTSSMTT